MDMDQIYCTLFDSNYLDKALVLYDSMCQQLGDFKLYVFAFDDRCYELLSKENLKNMMVISLKEFETPELLKVKGERTAAEYCWTCSPWVIKHVLDNYHEPICTYIDADMMFFSSPQEVFDDMRAKECSVIIVPHRFETEQERIKARDQVGEYCVQFNTFVNNENGMQVLNWWAQQCLNWCFYSVPGTTEWYGDQKYLNAFPEKFPGVYICNHHGVGLAPWNNKLVEYYDHPEPDKIGIRVKATGEKFPVVIYHFESVSFLTKNILHGASRMPCKKLHEKLYDVYIRRIIEKRIFVREHFGVELPKTRRVVTKNPVMRIYQKYISPIRRVKKISDLYWVKGG